MNTKAREILMNHGRSAFLRYCETQRAAAERDGYLGAAEYWRTLTQASEPL